LDKVIDKFRKSDNRDQILDGSSDQWKVRKAYRKRQLQYGNFLYLKFEFFSMANFLCLWRW